MNLSSACCLCSLLLCQRSQLVRYSTADLYHVSWFWMVLKPTGNIRGIWQSRNQQRQRSRTVDGVSASLWEKSCAPSFKLYYRSFKGDKVAEKFPKVLAQVVAVHTDSIRGAVLCTVMSLTNSNCWHADNFLISAYLNIIKKRRLEPERDIKRQERLLLKSSRCFWSGTGNGNTGRKYLQAAESLVSPQAFCSLPCCGVWCSVHGWTFQSFSMSLHVSPFVGQKFLLPLLRNHLN